MKSVEYDVRILAAITTGQETASIIAYSGTGDDTLRIVLNITEAHRSVIETVLEAAMEAPCA